MTPAIWISLAPSSRRPRWKTTGSGFISQAVAVSTTLMLRSFSRYLSMGWPETKKPRTSFSFWRRVCSSQSGAVGRASSLRAVLAGPEVGVEHAEEAVLAGGGVLLRFLGALDGLVEGGEDAGAGAEAVERSGFAEGLEDALVHEAEVDLVRRTPRGWKPCFPAAWSSLRAAMMDSMALWPTFLMAARPKTMLSPWG